jgi:hypothetical protein
VPVEADWSFRPLESSLRVDLDAEDINLEALPRFQRASFYAQRLLTLAAWLGGLALGILLVALWGPDTVWRPSGPGPGQCQGGDPGSPSRWGQRAHH